MIYPVILQHPICKYAFSNKVVNSVDHDHIFFAEASWSGSTVFLFRVSNGLDRDQDRRSSSHLPGPNCLPRLSAMKS